MKSLIYSVGLMLVAANSEQEAIETAKACNKIDDDYHCGFTTKCYIIPELIANVDKPKIIKTQHYIE